MTFKITINAPENFFTHKANQSDRACAKHKVRIIIKEKGGNWQDTVLLCEGELPEGTEIVLNCFPGKTIPHQLVRVLSFAKDLSELESGWFEAESELVQASHRLEESRNTSPVTVPGQRFDEWYRFVNEKIWIKFHLLENGVSEHAHSKLKITSSEWYRYQMVNKKYAKALARDILDDVLAGRDVGFDLNWLHDYQLMLVFNFLEDYLYALIHEPGLRKPEEDVTTRFTREEQEYLSAQLSKVVEDLKTSYFHHIPWPDFETFLGEFPMIERIEPSGYESDDSDCELPLKNISPSAEDSLNTGKEIIDGLLAANHVAFQTQKDAKNFLDCVSYYYPEANMKHDSVELGKRSIEVSVNPIGTDYDMFARMDFSDASLVEYIGQQLGVSIECQGSSSEEAFELRLKDLIQSIRAAYFEKLAEAFVDAFKLPLEKKHKLCEVFELEKTIDSETLQSILVTDRPLPTSRGLTAGSSDLGACMDPAVKPRDLGKLDGCEQLPVLFDMTQEALLEETRGEVFGYSEEELAQGCEKLLKMLRRSVTQLDKIYSDLWDDYSNIERLKAFKASNPEAQLLTSIGRLDPAKNVPAVLDAYRIYLEDCVSSEKPIQNALLLFIVPSRLEVPAYQEELQSILDKYAEICDFLNANGCQSEEWIYLAEADGLREYRETPPRHPKLITPNAMAEFYRLGNVVVSSSADGMNLVVKEWVAAQDRIVKSCLQDLSEFIKNVPESSEIQFMSQQDQALFLIYESALKRVFPSDAAESLMTKLNANFTDILKGFFDSYQNLLPELPILSQNAGASYQLKEAFLIDPLETRSMTASFHEMAELSPVQRVARALLLQQNVSKENGRHWRRSIIDQALGDVGLRKSQESLVRSQWSFWTGDWQVFKNPLQVLMTEPSPTV